MVDDDAGEPDRVWTMTWVTMLTNREVPVELVNVAALFLFSGHVDVQQGPMIGRKQVGTSGMS